MLLGNFLLSPLFQLMGVTRYLSPLLLTTRTRNGLAVHGGTAFDFVRHIRRSSPGEPVTRQVLRHFTDGLYALLEDVESGHVRRDATISCTSHIVNPRIFQSLGFQIEHKRYFAFAGFVNYLVLLVTASYTKARLVWPDLSKT
jgi:hypothetical protein